MLKIVQILSNSNGDWEGLYINGKLITEGHSLTYHDILKALGIEYARAECTMDGYEVANCPSTWAEAKSLPDFVVTKSYEM